MSNTEKRYTDQDTIDTWNKQQTKSTEQLVNEIEEILDQEFSDYEVECMFRTLKKRLGIKTSMPNTNTKQECIDFGMPEDEIIEVIEDEGVP